MIYRIRYDKSNRKLAYPVKDREELMALRNAPEHLERLAKVRAGDEEEKPRLLQLAYNMGHVEGRVAGCKSIGSYFFHDVDCYENSESIKDLILSKRKEIGLMMLERSARGGWHLVCKREPGTTILENQVRVATILQLEMDTNTKDLQRVVFTTSGSKEDLIYLDNALFDEPMTAEECEAEYLRLKERHRKKQEKLPKGALKANKHYRPWEECGMQNAECGIAQSGSPLDCFVPRNDAKRQSDEQLSTDNPQLSTDSQPSTLNAKLVEPSERTRFIARGVMKEKGLLAKDFLNEGGRHTTVKIFLSGVTQLLKKEETNGILAELMPEHWGDENIQQLVEDFYANYTNPNQRLLKYQEQLFTQSQRLSENAECGMQNAEYDSVEEVDEEELSTVSTMLVGKKLPQGVKDSVEAVGPHLAMPVITAICPAIGALATGVKLDVHGQKKGLNLIAYVAGDFASGKGQIDPVIAAWMREVKALDTMYLAQEDEWRAKKRAAKNKKEQPEEPKLPIRCLTLNNTVANLAERLANTEGKHAFSFTPEADTVAQKWRSSLSDFSIMLRESYDGGEYEREARSADAVNVHIPRLLWNVTMCGTPDALFRVVNNYTDGFQSRMAIARTPDNTFAPLEDNPYVMTPKQEERIQQIAHLLPLMQGEVVLPKLEKAGREWLEDMRLKAMMNNDKTKARQRMRSCVTAQRMTCCLMLCKVCEDLIQKHGLNGAENRLKQNPNLWKELLKKAQTPQMLELFGIIADSLVENALYFFRERIENAFVSRDYTGGDGRERIRYGKNDSIFERLDPQFSFEQAMQQSVAIKGASVTRNSVKQMLKNWSKQGLIERIEEKKYRKVSGCH